MKWSFVMAACVISVLSATACSSLTVVQELDNQRFTSGDRPVAHLSARVGGVYLFYYVPLVTGDAREPDRIRFFHNEQDVERVVHLVTRKSRELGATRLTDLYSWSDSVWSPFTLIFWYRWTSVSANASASAEGPPQQRGDPASP